MDKKKEMVKKNMTAFIKRKLSTSSVSNLDDIILDYIICLLEEINKDGDTKEKASLAIMQEAEDIQLMIDGYVSGFSSLHINDVHLWLVQLGACIATFDASPPSEPSEEPAGQTKDETNFPKINGIDDKSTSGDKPSSGQKARKRTTSSTSAADQTSEPSSSAPIVIPAEDLLPEDESSISVLLEMFPKACKMEAHYCLELSGWSLEKATGVMLHRQETGDSLQENEATRMAKTDIYTSTRGHKVDLKEQIINRYSYVDESEDSKRHNPRLPKAEPKKMIRYRDSQVVSSKGERFSDAKKPLSEEEKKTYVNLKPARQYRFH